MLKSNSLRSHDCHLEMDFSVFLCWFGSNATLASDTPQVQVIHPHCGGEERTCWGFSSGGQCGGRTPQQAESYFSSQAAGRKNNISEFLAFASCPYNIRYRAALLDFSILQACRLTDPDERSFNA